MGFPDATPAPPAPRCRAARAADSALARSGLFSAAGDASGIPSAGEYTALLWFVDRFNDFRIAELRSVAAMLGHEVRHEPLADAKMFLACTFPSVGAAIAVCGRLVLLRALLDVWGEGATYDEAVAACAALPPARKAPFGDCSFKVSVSAYGKKFDRAAQVARMERFADVGLQGRVEMRTPSCLFWVLEEHELALGPGTGKGRGGGASSVMAPDDGSTLRRVYFARQIGSSSREMVGVLDLKKRRYLGPTSMDAELSLVMANMAHARPCSLALDPCAGTGSILLACARFGAATLGTDISAPVLRGAKNGRALKGNKKKRAKRPAHAGPLPLPGVGGEPRVADVRPLADPVLVLHAMLPAGCCCRCCRCCCRCCRCC